MPDFNITWIDVGILFAYVIGTRILFGWYVHKKTKSGDSEEYFLAGRNIVWPIVGMSFYVSNMSGSTFVGLPASGYTEGVAVYAYEWIAVPILIFFLFFFLPFYLRAQVFTAPQFLETRFGKNSKLAFSGFLLFANVFIDAAAALYAGAIVFQVLFPGIPLWVTIVGASVIAGGYIFFGGLEAVVLNDTLQAALIFVGGLAITVLAWREIPSWEAVRAANPPEAFHLMRPATDDFLPWPGILAGVLIIGIYFWCTNQFIIQRALGARSLDDGRWGALLAGLLKLPNLFVLIIPGLMATVLYPGLTNPDLVFPTLAFDMLPIGLRGLMLAALAAAILSSLESILNSASTLFTMDIVRNFRPNITDRALTNTGRAATIGFMVLAATWAPQISRFQTLWTYLQSVLSYVTPPIVAVFVLGIFWRRATRQGAFATLAAGVPLGVVGFVLIGIFGVVQIQFLYASAIMLVASCLILVGVSLITPAPPQEKVEEYTWKKRMWRQESEELREKPFYKNYRYQSVVLLAITAVIVIWWW